jgi:geranylgeranyl diphosphate synthase type I
MTLTPGIQETLQRYQGHILEAMRHALQQGSANLLPTQAADLTTFYGQMQYHLGWVDRNFSPINGNPGKLLRPTLLLLAYEAAGSWGLAEGDKVSTDYLRRALPAAAALEITHNFTLIHDDIVDGDTERRHRPTLWRVWDSSQGINAGDGMFALGRLSLWNVLQEGVEADIAVRLAAALDRACLVISEGQFLDLNFEQRQDISVAMYLDMISRKTAALMSCATEMGGLLGTRDSATIESLRDFGFEIGLAFQVRDDVLGIWASMAELGKTSAGDIYRRKKSLPILHAMEHADEQDRQTLQQIYQQVTPITEKEVATVLAIFTSVNTREYCTSFLSQQCMRARHALDKVPRLNNATANRALEDIETLIHFVEATVQA